VRGTGRVFYYWWQEGVPAGGRVVEQDRNMTVRRRYTRGGKPVAVDREGRVLFDQGETYVVEIAVRAHRPAVNVAIADLLPAGLEIANPRIATSHWNAELPEDALKDEHGHRIPYEMVTPAHVELR